MLGFGIDDGYTTTQTKWNKIKGGSDVDYTKHLEAALRCACKDMINAGKYNDECELNEKISDLFDYYLFETDHKGNIEL